MWRGLFNWLARMCGWKPGGIEPHPDFSGDRGERRHAEALMEAQSRHAGHKP